MIDPHFRYLFAHDTPLDNLIEKRQNLIQDVHDLELELTRDSHDMTYEMIEHATRKITAIREKITYLTTRS